MAISRHEADELLNRLTAFMDTHIYPNEEVYVAQLNGLEDRFSTVPLMEELKAQAREAGLWNLWMPANHGGLTNEQYCPLAEIMGRVLWSPEVFNCNAPDTGNMEVFLKYATEEQKARWLEPLLNGEIRSSYAMTEPDVASSDATNVRTSIVGEGDEYVINGRKWFITNAPYERTKIFIVMGKSDPDNPNRHIQQSQVLVPRDAEGLEVVRPLTTLGYDDAPLGHAEVHFNDVRVPKENILLGEGRGFEIAQGRLGPGRIHHCMRLIGSAQRAVEYACRRSQERETLGAELSPDFHERTTVVAHRFFFSYAGLFAAYAIGFFVFLANTAEYPRGQFNVEAYTPLGLTLGALMVLPILVAALGTRSRIPYLPQASPDGAGALRLLGYGFNPDPLRGLLILRCPHEPGEATGVRADSSPRVVRCSIRVRVPARGGLG